MNPRDDLSELGGRLQFFLQCCMYFQQYPNGEVGKELTWSDTAVDVMSTLSGAIIDIFADAASGFPPRMVADRLDGSITIRVTVGRAPAVSCRGFAFMKKIANSVVVTAKEQTTEIAIEVTGETLRREFGKIAPVV